MQNKKVETFVSTFLFVLNEVVNRYCLARDICHHWHLLFLLLFFLSLVLLLTLGNTFHGLFLHSQVVLQEKHY